MERIKNLRRDISIYSIVFFLCLIFSSNIFASELSYRPEFKEHIFSTQSYNINRGGLQSKGYDVNDINDIKRAAFLDSESGIRQCAIWFLAIEMREDSIPILKKALDDVKPLVRRSAALYLGFLGDRSGLETMKKDMEELSQGGYDKITKEIRNNNPEVPLNMLSKASRIDYALEAARVLAQLGDASGFKLAVENATNIKYTVHRQTAIKILSENQSYITKSLYTEKFFEYVEQSKALILNNALQEARIKQFTDINNSLLDQENQIKNLNLFDGF